MTGSNGFVGRALCLELARNGHQVRAALRDPANLNIAGCEAFKIPSIDSNTDWTESIDGMDTVIHLAARVHVMQDDSANPLQEFRCVNVFGTLNLAKQAAEAGVGRFIFISSIKVNGESTAIGKPFTENDLPNPQDAYGVSKYEAEQGLLLIAKQTGMEVVIIRPPLVYGPGVKANFAALMHYVHRGWPLPLGAICNQRSLVGLGNLVDFIVTCIFHPQAANQTFLVSDGQDISTTELIRGMAHAVGVSERLLPVPIWVLQSGATMLGKRDAVQRLCGNLQVDISKAHKLLGWVPPITIADALKETALGLL